MKLIYPAIFTPCTSHNGYTVEVPDLPGCVSEGKTLEEAIAMGTDAASGWVLDELEDGNRAPNPTDIFQLEVPEGSFANLLVLDMDAYAAKYGEKIVRKNVSLPAWLNTFAENQNINFSQELQKSLLKIYYKTK